jgi:hypothetical protein
LHALVRHATGVGTDQGLCRRPGIIESAAEPLLDDHYHWPWFTPVGQAAIVAWTARRGSPDAHLSTLALFAIVSYWRRAMIELNTVQRQAMAQGQPVRIVDPDTHAGSSTKISDTPFSGRRTHLLTLLIILRSPSVPTKKVGVLRSCATKKVGVLRSCCPPRRWVS